MAEQETVSQQLRKALDDFLKGQGAGLEEVVNTRAFGSLVAQTTGNLVALTRISNEVLDLAIRNSRLAGRRDVASLGRQLARTEEKLERVLQVVERLEDELADSRARNAELEEAAARRTTSSAATTAKSAVTAKRAPK
ncbi:hypothetical protein CGZ93_07540 [Enemella dayhoffiae]|uniref:Uncharacterized protein n=1 Tax=Enemella dayhoffiae TaxID=2016507 RepID=A0A255H666_9ACTN|nr:hypothetical protein [Enemella dayhoffiae]OYO22693.1 hypothetical protein CGZ93_07540 [Enemella dayhoffiae]